MGASELMHMAGADLRKLLKNRERMVQRARELCELGYEGEKLCSTLIDELSDIPIEDLQNCTRSLIASIERQSEIEGNHSGRDKV